MRSFLYGLLGTLILVLLINGCGSGERAKYYRQVSLDGRYDIIGRYPVSREMAMKGESYRFVFDNEENLTRVEHIIAGEIRGESFFGRDVAWVEIDAFEMHEKRSYYDVEGLPCGDKNGINSIGLPFTEDGYPREKLNYDSFGDFLEDNYGVCHYIWVLDDEGRRIRVNFYDRMGKQIAGTDGVFERRFKYDGNDNMVERIYLDSKGKLKADANGIAVLRQEFDSSGNVIEIRHFDARDKLMEMTNGAFVIHRKFDENGNAVEESYRGKEGKSIENNMGVAIVRSEFDPYGNIVERKYYDVNDELTEGAFYGFATLKWEYDEKGRMTETRFLDVNGELKNALNEEAAIMRVKYDEDGDIKKVLRFDKEGKLVGDTTGVPTKD